MNFYHRLTSREKTLVIIVGGILFLLVNMALIKTFITKKADLAKAYVTKENEWNLKKMLFVDKDLWVKRQKWLNEKLPKLTNPSTASNELLEYTKKIGKDHGVLIETPNFGTPSQTPHYQSVAIELETKSSWEALAKFLYDLQQPERFIMIENADIQIDSADRTQIRVKNFRIAKCYAPKGK